MTFYLLGILLFQAGFGGWYLKDNPSNGEIKNVVSLIWVLSLIFPVGILLVAVGILMVKYEDKQVWKANQLLNKYYTDHTHIYSIKEAEFLLLQDRKERRPLPEKLKIQLEEIVKTHAIENLILDK